MKELTQSQHLRLSNFIHSDRPLGEGEVLRFTVATWNMDPTKLRSHSVKQLIAWAADFLDNHKSLHVMPVMGRNVITTHIEKYFGVGSSTPQKAEIDFSVSRDHGNYYVEMVLNVSKLNSTRTLTLFRKRVVKSYARSKTNTMLNLHSKLIETNIPKDNKNQSTHEYNVRELEAQLKLAQTKLAEINKEAAAQRVIIYNISEQLERAKQVITSLEITYSNMEEQLKLIKEQEAKYGIKYKIYDYHNRMIELEILGKGTSVEGNPRIFTTRGRSVKIIAIVK